MRREINEELLIKVMLEEASPAEKTIVEEWVSASAENEREYTNFKLIWETSAQLGVKSNVDENEAWSRFKQKLELKQEGEKVKRLQLLPLLKVAAILILVSVGLWVSYLVLVNPVNTIIVQTSNETKIDTLPDGSVITLNKNSKLSYPSRFAGNSREIKLNKGEAFFNVLPDASKPFIIHIDDVKVKVVGTSFNIKIEKDRTELIVETGIVEVRKKDIVVRLKRDEMVKIDRSEDTFDKEINSDQLYKYYRNKEFILDGTPLWRLVEVLNEAYDVTIVIDGKELENIPLNTTFKNNSLDAILNIICETLNIKADKRGKQIILHQ